ncbi:fimbrial biogenesis chaperone [Serratia proteamaculans]|uniref:Fimbria/pilus periplasmic chaperone n=1 Tax=Serratia proteamaculans TaxID=28151 RepID=A0A5Q2VC94_SERPR|nr:molecular chaperone [Serratia proteamaculans]QGH61988.1 fimbria/pilus periplasmic chaperone [Serratia proteamaculans]
MSRTRGLTLIALMMVSSLAQGSVVLGGTRVIYDAGKKESNISVKNPTDKPFLVQSWVKNNDDAAAKTPFIITPPLFRLDGKKENVLRIIHTGGLLPQDRESLLWLNVKAIPSSADSDVNTLQIAVNTQIKLIYRPKNLPGTPTDAAKVLDWTLDGNQLKVTNNSPYFMNFQSVKINGQEIDSANMAPPKSTSVFKLNKTMKTGSEISWKIINDYGGSSALMQKIK